MSYSEKFKEEFPVKKTFYSLLRGKKISGKEYKHVKHVLKVWNKFEMKKMNSYHDLYLKYDVLF